MLLKKEFNLDFDERLKWFELNERAFNKVYSKVQSLNLKIDMQEEDIENGIYGRDVSRDQAMKVLHEDRVDFTAWSYILKLIENEIIHK